MIPHDLHYFEFPNFDIREWSYGHLLRVLPPELASLSRRDHSIFIKDASVEKAIVEITSPNQIATLTLHQFGKTLQIGCDCGIETTKICRFQVQAILNLIENTDLRLFFDADRRRELIHSESSRYGLAISELPETYLELVLQNHIPVVRPINAHLQPVDEEQLQKLALRLVPRPPATVDEVETTVKILVWTQSRFNEHFLLTIYEAFLGGKGNLRGPLKQLHAVDLMLEAENKDQLKFYGAVAKLSSRANSQIPNQKAFYWLLKNPDELPVYIHNFNISETVSPTALRRVEMVSKEIDLTLYVHESSPFYQISGVLTIAGKYFDLLETKLRYGNFLLAGDRLHLIEHEGIDELIKYLQQNRNKIVLHRNKYPVFRNTILAKVEQRVRVVYTYLKQASQKKRLQLLPEGSQKKVIYLDDAGQFVHITPVLRYGTVELPVFSPRVLYMTDQDGRPYQVERDTKTEIELATSLKLAHPEFVEQFGQDFLYLHKSRFFDENWFLKTFDNWRSEGIEILGYHRIRNNHWNPNSARISVHVTSGIDWFETKVGVKFGEEIVPLRQLFTSVRNKTRYIPLSDGSMGILPQEWLEKLTGFFRIGHIYGDSLRTARQHFQELKSIYPEAYIAPELRTEINELIEKLENVDQLPSVRMPESLRTQLRDYQYTGVNWLKWMSELKFGACLADDMGLGKTLQVIALLLLEKEQGLSGVNLIVMPASLLFNWQSELAQHAPTLKVGIYYGEGRKMDFKEQQIWDIVLTTYTVMTTEIHRLRTYPYSYVILDESHNIKNPSSQRYRAACQLQAKHRLILTGTPIENNTWDLYGQFSFVCPGLLGSKRYFKDQYQVPIEKFKDDKKREELQNRIKPFFLRRTKEQVAKELPPKTEMVLYCEMPPAQRRVYDAYAEEFRNYLDGKSDGDIAREKMHVLQGLTKLRQLCISPALLNDEEYYGAESAKMDVLLEQLESLINGHKVLVFSQFVSALELIKKELELRRIGYSWLVGDTRNRGQVVSSFENDPGKRVFLVSLKAGGTGLNLTAADYVILVDPWWNPAVENQAIDRTHRIGQKKNVVAVRLICPNTIEERIVELQTSKKELTEELIQTYESTANFFDKNTLMKLLSSV